MATQPSEVISVLFGKGRKKVKPGPVFRAYQQMMKWAGRARTLKVRTNADQPDQCDTALPSSGPRASA